MNQLKSRTLNRDNSSGLLTPALGLKWSPPPLPPTSHRPPSSEPTPSEPNWTARPSWQDDIKKGGGEEEGAEQKESASLPEPVPASQQDLGGGRRPLEIRHHVTASQSIPRWRSARRGRTAEGSRAAAAGARSGDRGTGGGGVAPTRSPPARLGCQRAARPAPSPNTHSLRSTTTRAARPGSPPAPLRAGPQCQARAPAAGSRVSATLASSSGEGGQPAGRPPDPPRGP